MTIRESALSSTLDAQPSSKKRQPKRPWTAVGSARTEPLSMLLDSQVMTFHEWCRLNRFSERTGRRLLKSGDGPVIVQLSPMRIGITVRANREWQASRVRVQP
jgi:hypothetical protein